MAIPVYQVDAGNTSLLNKKIGTLDGSRGLAILLVTGYHYLHFFTFGWVGVDLFFVLSGFLITGKLVESLGAKNYFRSFYIKRILRIVPLYYTVIFLFFVLLPFVWPAGVSVSLRDLLQQQFYYWSFTANIYDAFHGWPVNISLVHCWSVCCEMQFYLVWPFIIWFLYRGGHAVKLLLLFVVLSLLFRVFAGSLFPFNSIYRYSLLPCRLDAFCAGALVYHFLKDGRMDIYKKRLLPVAAMVLVLVLLLMRINGIPWHFSMDIVSKYGYTFNAIFWACILGFILVSHQGLLKRVFGGALLQWFGKYSYAMYLFHLPVYIFIGRLNFFNNGAADKTWSLAMVAFAVTCAASFASYHLLEKYFLKLKPVS